MPPKTAKISKNAAARKHFLNDDGKDELKTSELVFGKGKFREYLVTSPSADIKVSRSIATVNERICLLVLALISLVVRLNKLSQPDSVVFDEVHFGGFSKKYILGSFFMDVHPPLAKMLFAGVGVFGGFKGDFDFAKIGDVYPETVPYVLMRTLPALLGVGTIILLYLTLRASGCKPIPSAFTSALLLIENANFTISRYILLDSPLLFFIAAAIYSAKKHENEIPFTWGWYKTLISTGVSLGLAVSSKWVGLFTIAWVGLITAFNLWFTIGDLSVTPKKIIGQIFSKLIILLGLPIILYLYFFNLHFQILNKEGDGSAFMSSAFRSTLIGNKIPTDIQADVGVGSKVTLRHLNTEGGYLHSHNHLFETGSKQQQVTLYPHLDENNIWTVELYNVSEPPTSFEPITDGTKIRLNHILTKRRLHSHDIRPPVTEHTDWQNEVSAYGFEGFEGDPNDDFIVEIVKKKSKKGEAQERVRALETIFRLRHAMTGCYLFSHEVKLPTWGFEQQEVTCASQGIVPLSLWYVETNENEFLPEDAERINYEAPSFFQKFYELHQKMWKINRGLTESHAWESSPDSWPFLLRGINYWGKDHKQVYFIGNFITWWASTAAIIFFFVYTFVNILRWQRGCQVGSSPDVFNFNVQMLHFILGWAVHYAPSFMMERQLFLHHYLPSFYFALLALGHVFDIIYSFVLKSKRLVSYAILGGVFSSAITVFLKYSPLIKGDPWTKQQCESSKLISTWDFDCNNLLNSLEEYSGFTSSLAHSSEPTTATKVNFQSAVPVENFYDDYEENEKKNGITRSSDNNEASPTDAEDTVGEPEVEKVGET
ncbi:hypothetical protein PACTADRAFT_49828 [Pachysolen tannophilus NRRL Y-2460]|uniref:Dolichyl-phosphate-mannose--protein mannosyltransferase n=1 Tax=Pachysolen tannophilus NRRL Y-2460 TaxID=669874 RepID=A0A1E4TXN7_PACTA|nr:hypothetical protein PACTADRAFT_49828 [Pachysolen tannophilus NRRL Y-2460]